MEKFITKMFWPKEVESGGTEAIDLWLNSFVDKDPKKFRSYEIVGYVSTMNVVIITVKVWESEYQKHEE